MVTLGVVPASFYLYVPKNTGFSHFFYKMFGAFANFSLSLHKINDEFNV